MLHISLYTVYICTLCIRSKLFCPRINFYLLDVNTVPIENIGSWDIANLLSVLQLNFSVVQEIFQKFQFGFMYLHNDFKGYCQSDGISR